MGNIPDWTPETQAPILLPEMRLLTSHLPPATRKSIDFISKLGRLGRKRGCSAGLGFAVDGAAGWVLCVPGEA